LKTERLNFACPRCDRLLDAAESGWRCSGCRVDFPSVGGLPWLFAEPNAALAEWRGRFDYLLRALEANVRRYRETAKRDGLIAATRDRLETLAQATEAHAENLRRLLEPLALAEPAAQIETFLALRTRLPPDQGLMTYFPNIHRDWCWGQEENDASLAIVIEALGEHQAGNTLVLGAGAGRLAYDLHAATSASTTIALDFNPLLVLLGSRLAAGETIELHEFPLAPLDVQHLAPLRQLSAPRPARAGLEFICADVHRAPFPQKCFDTIVTPWLVDILPGDFGELCTQINRWLVDGGTWINFGSLNFHQADTARQLGPTECFELIMAHGFAEPWHKDTPIPYMSSPASRLARRETVLSWRAAKIAHQKMRTRHRALPDWIVRGREPVPALEHFRVAAASTRIHAHIMAMIDGRRSIADMSKLLEQQRLMAAADAEAAIRGLLIKLYDESQIRRP
jgi:hypothetical protein